MKKNEIRLTPEQRGALEKFSRTGVHSARLIKRAEIMLLLDKSESGEALTFEEVSYRLGVSLPTISNVRNDFLAAKDVQAFLQRRKRLSPPVEPKATGEVEAHVIAMACGKPPEGCAKWTLRLIAERCVELGVVDSISHTTVGRLLKKRRSSPT
jgi:hypothetical protein